jgi:hypothetical protein
MQIISAATVEQVFSRMWNLSQPEAYRLSYDLEKEQPLLVSYLAAVDKNIFNRAERELLFYLGTVIWQVMSNIKSPLPSLQADCLLRCEEANNSIAGWLKNTQNVNFKDAVKKVLQESRQIELMRYVIAALMDENSDENEVRDENLGYIILDLKTVIECFDSQT